MIEKILDKYYCKKMKKFLDTELLGWFIDHRYKENDYFLGLQIKREEFNDEQYKEILSISKPEIFTILCNQELIRKVLKERVEKYLVEEVNE